MLRALKPLALALRWYPFLFAALIVAAAWRLPFIPDEAYYWTWSRQLELRYLDHPPAIAWLIALEERLLGASPLALRAASLSSIVGAALLLVDATYRRAGREGAELALLLLLASPMFVVGLVPITPDPIHALLTALASNLAVRAFERDELDRRSLFLLAWVLTIAIGVKHYAGLVGIGAVLGALRTSGGRARLGTYAPWLGFFLGLVMLAPWLSEELRASPSSFEFQLDRVMTSRPRVLLAIPLVFGSLMGTLGVFTAPGLIAISAGRSSGPSVDAVLAGGATALLLGCVGAAAHGSGEANWPLPAMLFALPTLVAWTRDRGLMRVARRIGALGACVVFVLLVHTARPLLPIPPAQDPTARGVGFDVVAATAEREAERVGAVALITRRYQFASLLRFHTRDRRPVLELGSPGGRRSQYDEWPRPRLCRGDKAVLVMSSEIPPSELVFTPIGARRRIERRVPGRAAIDAWFVGAVSIEDDFNCER
ncbi:MAG: glycosyltransferase family 39 protein [Deltaproteobacteria bacterium]|nr:glycosyltransferase family 39 protein [Deltaproteobacteria bacterium]